MSDLNPNYEEQGIRPQYALWAGLASVLTVALLIAVKAFTYWQSGSLSVLASLTDSVVDAVASIVTFLAIFYAIRPADKNHRYGHGKAEGLAALMQGLFILGAGGYLLFEAFQRFSGESVVRDHWLAIGVMAFSVAASVVLVRIQKYALEQAPSLAVEADQAHYSMDILINTGVIIVLFALKYGAPAWIDPAFAVLVCFYLAYIAYGITRKGLDMLLDHELSTDKRQKILSIIRQNKEVLGVHDLRTRKTGMRIHIAFDIELDPQQTLYDAHEVTLELEQALLEEFPHAEIMIHKDPHGMPEDESRHPDIQTTNLRKGRK